MLQKLFCQIENQLFEYTPDGYTDISLPLTPGGDNPNCYYAEQPSASVIRFGDSFVGSVALGGTCNYQKLTLTPHGNGTHTECSAHITDSSLTVNESLKKFSVSALLISIDPANLKNGDLLVTEKAVTEAIESNTEISFPEALIIRTLPNENTKKYRAYSGTNPPYLEPSLGTFLRKRNFKHLLVDLPSVDREEDGGKLSVHRGFWNVPASPSEEASITELIFVPEKTPDGVYLLQFGIPNIALDAVPSRILIFPLKKTDKHTLNTGE